MENKSRPWLYVVIGRPLSLYKSPDRKPGRACSRLAFIDVRTRILPHQPLLVRVPIQNEQEVFCDAMFHTRSLLMVFFFIREGRCICLSDEGHVPLPPAVAFTLVEDRSLYMARNRERVEYRKGRLHPKKFVRAFSNTMTAGVETVVHGRLKFAFKLPHVSGCRQFAAETVIPTPSIAMAHKGNPHVRSRQHAH